MPPTIQSGSDRRSRGTGAKGSELVCRVKYNNSLPDIPFDPKFITYPFEQNRFVQYNPTSLERTYKHELLTEPDLGVVIDLINPDTYKVDVDAYLDIEDEKLLDDDTTTQSNQKRSRHHNKNVSWLRKTEYISTEYNRFVPSADKAESKIGFSIKKYFKEEDLYRDRDSQIKAIEETFQQAKTEIGQHYSKPGVHPVEVMDIYPDFDLWKHPCAQVIFDADPAPKGKTMAAQMEDMSQAMIRGMVDESGDQFVAYFLPTEETVTKRKRDTDHEIDYEEDEEYDYVLEREYNWNVKNKASKGYEETYFFVTKDGNMYYNELETRVRLSKRRKLAGTGTGAPSTNSRLIVKHRPMDEQETGAQDGRIAMLDHPVEEEVDEEAIFGTGEQEDGVPLESGFEEQSAEKSGSDEDEEKEKVPPAESESGDEAEGEKKEEPMEEEEGEGKKGSGDEEGFHSPSSGSGSESESEAEQQKKKDEEEIFGSASSGED